MHTQASPRHQRKSRSVAQVVAQRQGEKGSSHTSSGDNTPAQSNLTSNTHVAQLQALQEMANQHSSQGVVQRVCYSIAGGDQTSGSEAPGSAFVDAIVGAYYQDEANLAVTSYEADEDQETGEAISRQRQLSPLIGNIDHIVPANLGGGGLEGNSRPLRADHNQGRQDNFGVHNTKHPLSTVRVVHNETEYTSAQTAIDNGATDDEIQLLITRWWTPWGIGGPLTDDRDDSDTEEDLETEDEMETETETEDEMEMEDASETEEDSETEDEMGGT
ncbi:MAG: hypothetical protein AAFQ83_24050 [Bacteroidota bacterium]